MTGTNNNKTVLIVGGGPSGASAAKAMADRGYTNVHLYEAYPHPNSLSSTSSKAYVIALSPRGQQGILDSTGIDVLKESSSPSSKLGVVSKHLARHVHNAKTQKTSSKARPSKGVERAIVTRQALTERLLEAAEESGVRVHYQHRLVDIDFDNKLATFAIHTSNRGSDDDDDDEKEATPTMIEANYDLLIAADGCHSRVRNLMVENESSLKDFSAVTKEDSMEYQVVVLPKNPFKDIHPEGTTHSWNLKELNSICLAFEVKNENKENGMLFALVFPEGQLESFRTKGYKDPLTKLLPDLFDDKIDESNNNNLKEFETQLRVNQIGNGGLCVWSSALGHGRSGIVLLGDSGHGMWPSLGQGANCALESVGVFVRCLDELDSQKMNNDDDAAVWTGELVQRFQTARFGDATSAVDLTYGGIGARESRGRLNAPFSSKLQMIGMMLLHKLTFGLVPMPALLRILMGYKDLSYSTAKKFHFEYEKYICLGALAALFVAGTILFVGRTSAAALSGTNSAEL